MYWYHLFFEFHGRIGRGTFWLGILVLLGVELAILLPLMQNYAADLAEKPPALWFRNLTLLVDTALAWPSLALMAKRQHDRDQRPLLAYFSVVLTVAFSMLDAFGLVQDADGFTTLGKFFWMVLLGVMVVVIIELGCRAGTQGPNRFGQPPETAE